MKLWIGTVAWLALAGCDKGGDSAGGDLVGDPVAGEKVFQSTCANVKCHGPDGSGSGEKSKAADLADEVPTKSDAEIETIIREGFALMPAVDPPLSDQEIADVIAYLRQEFPG